MDTHIKIGDVSPRIQYTANGTQIQFTYPFPIFQDADLQVYLGEALQSSGYSIIGAGDSAGGTVEFDSAPSSSVTVTLARRLAIQRTSDFQESGAFRSKVINDELDYLSASLQQVSDDQSRSLQMAITQSSSIDTSLPTPMANGVLAYNASGSGFVNGPTVDEVGNAQMYATNASASASVSAASAMSAAASEINAASSAAAAAANATAAGVSTTSLMISVGSHALTTDTGKFFEAGQWLLMTSDADPTNYMHGYTSAYTTGTGALTFEAIDVGGSGTFSDWTLRLSGTKGAKGDTGDKGDTGQPQWQGVWLTSTAYVLNDSVSNSGNSYICVTAHTSGDFAADLAAVKWELMAQKGADGLGTGDVVGPASATHNALACFNGATGKLLQDSGVTLDDTANMAGLLSVATDSITAKTIDADLSISGNGTGVPDIEVGFKVGGLTNTFLVDADIGVSVQAYNVDLATVAANGVGSGANQIVQLNGSGELPAVSGANLTNLPGGGILIARTMFEDTSNTAHYNAGGMANSGLPGSGEGMFAFNFTTSYTPVDPTNDFYFYFSSEIGFLDGYIGTAALYFDSETTAFMAMRHQHYASEKIRHTYIAKFSGLPTSSGSPHTIYLRHGYGTYTGNWSTCNGGRESGPSRLIIEEVAP